MNERIADLSHKARMLATIAANDLTGPHHCKIGSDYFLALKEQRFARLIIEECVGVCMNVNNDLPRTEPLVAASIKKHFGVE